MDKSLQIVMDRQSRKTVVITSIVLLLAGIVGIALPQFMSMAVALFAGWLMIVAGSIAFYGSSAELVGNYGLKRGSSQSIQGVKRQG
jgi:uncharacterized membrane protein HdeD (DUF308 family)